MPEFEDVQRRLSEIFVDLANIEKIEEELLPDFWDQAVEEFNERYGFDLDPELEYERERKSGKRAGIVYRGNLPPQMRMISADNPVKAELKLQDFKVSKDSIGFVVETDGDVEGILLDHIFSQSDYYRGNGEFEIPKQHVRDQINKNEDEVNHNLYRVERFLDDEEKYYLNEMPYGELYLDFIGEEPVTIDEVKEKYGEKLPQKAGIRAHLNDLVEAGILDKKRPGSKNQYYVPPSE